MAISLNQSKVNYKLFKTLEGVIDSAIVGTPGVLDTGVVNVETSQYHGIKEYFPKLDETYEAIIDTYKNLGWDVTLEVEGDKRTLIFRDPYHSQ